MIQYKQLDTGQPRDIEVTTDDKNAELVAMQEALHEMEDSETYRNLSDAHMSDGSATFTIPGDEAGEVSEAWDFADINPSLGDFLDDIMSKLLEDS